MRNFYLLNLNLKNFFKIISPKFFIILISFSIVIYFFWLLKLLNDFPWRYVFTDWIINYKGGYIRRGLIGEVSTNLSIFFNTNINYIFFIIHFFIYFLFHYFFYKFFSVFKKNYLFYVLCFSPLVFLYPLSTFEALARKEIFFITLFLINCYFLTRVQSRNIAFLLTNICFIFSYFIHESSFIFLIFFYLTFYVFLKQNNLKIKLPELFIALMVIIFLGYLLFMPVTELKLLKMISYISENFFLISRNSGAISAIHFNTSGINLFLKDNYISLKYIIRYLLLSHFVIFFLYILYFKNLPNLGKFFWLFCLGCFLSPVFLFLIASDWGRFVYILYNFCLIFSFFCLYQDKQIFFEIDQFSVLRKISFKFKLFFTLCYVSLWNPKIWFFEDIELFPLFNVLFDVLRYSFKYTSIIIQQ